MQNLIATRISLVWLLLVGSTLVSWALDQGQGFDNHQHASIAIIVIALIKVRFVISEFMEVRGAPMPLKIAADTWVVLVCILLIALYLTVR